MVEPIDEHSDHSGNRDPTNGLVQAVGVVIAAVLLLAGPVAFAGLCIILFPDHLPASQHPDFIDNIFDSRTVIWAARLLLVSAAFVLAVVGSFIVASTTIRMKHGEWLKRAGPFEVSEIALTDLEAQIEFWRGAALDGQDELAEIRARLEESDKLIEQLHLVLYDG